jgi:porin
VRPNPLPALVALTSGLLAAGPAKAVDDCGSEACRGYSVAVTYLGEQWWNTAGGLRTDDTWLDNLDLVAAADRGSLGVPGLGGRLVVLRNNANEFSPTTVGDLQIVSNIDAPAAWRLYEAWVEWSPADASRFSVRAGIYAADQEFNVAPTGALFLHSAPGTSTDYALSGLIGPPIFPLSGWAVRVAGGFGDGGYWLAAVMDGVPGNPDDFSDFHYRWEGRDGALLQAEAGVTGGRWNKVALGAWTYSTELETLSTDANGDPVTEDWEAGFYLIADRQLASGGPGDLDGYVQAGAHKEGFANRSRFNVFTRFLGAGVTLSRFLPRRPDDEVGFMVATGFIGDQLRDDRAAEGLATNRHETALELTYRAPITDWLAIQPDVQYVINPGIDPDVDDAVVVGVRFEVTFGRQW